MTHEGISLVGLAFFKPLLVFLMIFIIFYALLKNTKVLGGENFIQMFSAFLISSIFVTTNNIQELVLVVTQGFTILIIAGFFMLALTGFLGKSEIIGKGFAWIFVISMFVIFIISGMKIFGKNLFSYLPGPNYGVGMDKGILYFLDILYSPNVLGTILFVAITGVVMLILVKSGK